VGEETPDNGTTSGTGSGTTNRASNRQEYYTVSEAAKVLELSERRVRQLVPNQKIEGVRSDARWKVFRYSVHAFRDRRLAEDASRGTREASSKAREWIERVRTPRSRT
jgi:excisionase family DNA binding protein